jgi:phosphohistidine phosphatase
VDGPVDAARELSPKGVEQIRVVAKFLRGADALDAAEFWHSPLVRSRDTAALLARRLRTGAKLVEVGGLRPEDDPRVLARKLDARREPVAVVGHEPHLSALASLLVTDAAVPPRFVFKKGAVLRLDRSEGAWVARWQIGPELL